jgi:hypothetical protein
MATQEFYVRGVNDTEARGPFTVEQLVTLGEIGQIDTETLYYDASTEQWAAIGANEELKNAVFPQKKKLAVKAKENIKFLNVAKEEHKPITVEQMLAAAEGRTEETKDARNLINAQNWSAKIGIYSGLVMFLLSATALVLPHADMVLAVDLGKIAGEPLVILGLVDLVCAVLLGLGMSAAYPFIRFRAVLGIGFLGLLYWLQDQPMVALAVAVGSAGMYFCTVFLSYAPIITAALLGLAGMGGFAFFMLR